MYYRYDKLPTVPLVLPTPVRLRPSLSAELQTTELRQTTGRTTTKDMEPTRQADIFPMPLKQKAAAARMIPDNYVLTGL